jgi:hypothetical protein
MAPTEQTACVTSLNNSQPLAPTRGQFPKASPVLIFWLRVVAAAEAPAPLAVAVAVALQQLMAIRSRLARSLTLQLAQVVQVLQIHQPRMDQVVHHLVSCETQ